MRFMEPLRPATACFDCAASYGNEAEIGKVFAKAFAEGIVQRQELTIYVKGLE